MKREISKFEKVFSRDFTLAKVEIWYRSEAINPKQWTDQKQPFSPYIIFERAEGTVGCYYNKRGMEWTKNLLIKKTREDRGFLLNIENTIKEKLKSIYSIYENEILLDHADLLKFLDNIEDIFPWLEAMWWFCEMTSPEVGSLDISRMQKTRELTGKLSAGTDTVIRKSLESIFSEIKGFIGVLSGEEIKSKMIPNKDILEKRDKGYFYTSGQLFIDMSKKDIENKFEIILKEVDIVNNTSDIRGMAAYPGLISGVVRKVMGHKDINKVKEEEILVSPMTMPDFLPAMKKVAAIVTDEGGLLSHAAIISRELNIPCIIGTKIATKVLKDGDLVEVDANKGIVKILKRKR